MAPQRSSQSSGCLVGSDCAFPSGVSHVELTLVSICLWQYPNGPRDRELWQGWWWVGLASIEGDSVKCEA